MILPVPFVLDYGSLKWEKKYYGLFELWSRWMLFRGAKSIA